MLRKRKELYEMEKPLKERADGSVPSVAFERLKL